MAHKILLTTAVFAAALIGFAWLTLPSSPAFPSYPGIQTPATTTAINTTATTTSSTTTSSGYTLAQIQTHGNITSCWAAINGKVYDLTSWINQHPGGPEHILAICGTDGSSAFNAQHGGQREPAQELAQFYIGDLIQ